MKMIWSVGEWNEDTHTCDDRSAIVDGKQLSDGIVNIVFDYMGLQTSAAVVVADGKFTEQADELIGNCVDRAGYWGHYIEGFHYNNEGQIEVIIGS